MTGIFFQSVSTSVILNLKIMQFNIQIQISSISNLLTHFLALAFPNSFIFNSIPIYFLFLFSYFWLFNDFFLCLCLGCHDVKRLLTTLKLIWFGPRLDLQNCPELRFEKKLFSLFVKYSKMVFLKYAFKLF